MLNHEGTLVYHSNVSGGIPDDLESLVINLVSAIPDVNKFINFLQNSLNIYKERAYKLYY